MGGTTQRMFEEGPELSLLGYPVTLTNCLASSGAAMVGVFGDLSQGGVLGTRRNVTIKRFDELYGALEAFILWSKEADLGHQQQAGIRRVAAKTLGKGLVFFVPSFAADGRMHFACTVSPMRFTLIEA